MGLGLVTHVPIQVLPLNYQCCMTAQIPNIYSAVGRKGRKGKWKCWRGRWRVEEEQWEKGREGKEGTVGRMKKWYENRGK